MSPREQTFERPPPALTAHAAADLPRPALPPHFLQELP